METHNIYVTEESKELVQPKSSAPVETVVPPQIKIEVPDENDILQEDNDMNLELAVYTDADVVKRELDCEIEYEGLEEQSNIPDCGNSDKMKQEPYDGQNDFEEQFAHSESIVRQIFDRISKEEKKAVEGQFSYSDSSLIKQEYEPTADQQCTDQSGHIDHMTHFVGGDQIQVFDCQTFGESSVKQEGQDLSRDESFENDQNIPLKLELEVAVADAQNSDHGDFIVKSELVGDDEVQMDVGAMAVTGPEAGDLKVDPCPEEDTDNAPPVGQLPIPEYEPPSFTDKESDSSTADDNWRPSKRKRKSTRGKRNSSKPRNKDNAGSPSSHKERERFEGSSTSSTPAGEALVKTGAGRGRYSQVVEDVPVVKVHRVNPMGIPLLNPLASQGASGKVTHPGQFITLQGGPFCGAQVIQLVNAQLGTQTGTRVSTPQGIQVCSQVGTVSTQPGIQVVTQPSILVGTRAGIQDGTQQSIRAFSTQLGIPIPIRTLSTQGVETKCAPSTALPKLVAKKLPTLMPKGVPAEHTVIYSKKKRFACKFCGKEFDANANLKRHELLHTGERPFKCELCDKTFIQSVQLEIHKRTHTGRKPFKCAFCDKAFTEARYLKKHVVLHTGEKSFKCKICSEDFVSWYRLSLHEKTHTGKMLFNCKMCKAGFSKRIDYVLHKQQEHLNRDPWKCDECGKIFTCNSELKNHSYQHSGQKPFECGYCQKRFRLKAHMLRHETLHTGEKVFKCATCAKEFYKDWELVKHRQSHTEQQ
ncbi:transcriptional regulator Kaiso-like [Lineus longissimus]|uniref:transcriptional regulator Kaiso-like n=1 Tax=Lineus longissimus TaxID=88925 RepID=UPI00315D9DA3